MSKGHVTKGWCRSVYQGIECGKLAGHRDDHAGHGTRYVNGVQQRIIEWPRRKRPFHISEGPPHSNCAIGRSTNCPQHPPEKLS